MGACMNSDYVVYFSAVRVRAENEAEAKEKAIEELQKHPELLAAREER